ncbi:adenylate/guanylate cyclase domain-containing protein [Dongia rigui]|uniref:Adenylate/guanylate cyclase domain-containing protein n=1 Tax=Dongia rigui TaxID=940149 RepID=A0ABU5DY39_9PROT|nr:adenylate/guanylate cyclase domain-containing protein [Dongia rigui]MDY0872190.1 adenylate/guanylate cyclase domain-containing protein [Dongia rigui]
MTQLPANDMDGFGRLVAWLAQAALGDTGKRSDGTLDNNLGALTFAEVFAEFCNRLNDWIGPFSRISIAMEVLHPELSGGTLYWRDGEIEERQVKRAGILTWDDYLRSPVYVIEQTNRPWRWRVGDAVPDMPLIQDLSAQGNTDYCLFPLPFQDTNRTSTMSFATRRPGGFADLGGDDLGAGLLRRIAWAITPFMERVALRIIALDLLDAYVGKIAGKRVYGGQVERGAVEPIDAAILVADLRGFTSLSEVLGEIAMVDLLNRYFDTLGGAIAAHDGQILKFMGDGLLAVFPITDDASRANVHEAAVLAALAARGNLATLNAALLAEGRAPIDFGIGLHAGSVAFGNIGTGTRLDFTVIGPAVNQASRIQDLTKELHEPVLASGGFTAILQRPMRLVGARTLRGVEKPVELFAPMP